MEVFGLDLDTASAAVRKLAEEHALMRAALRELLAGSFECTWGMNPHQVRAICARALNGEKAGDAQ